MTSLPPRAQQALDAYLDGRSLDEALATTETRLLREDRLFGPGGDVVYLLIDPEGHVLYVGQSICWPQRAGAHDGRWGGVTARAQIIRVPAGVDRLGLEQALIRLLEPPLNRSGVSVPAHLPLGRWSDEQVTALLDERLAGRQPRFPDAPPAEGWPTAMDRLIALVNELAHGEPRPDAKAS
jgi:hypothetical protein